MATIHIYIPKKLEEDWEAMKERYLESTGTVFNQSTAMQKAMQAILKNEIKAEGDSWGGKTISPS